ncbi:hypothetical protein L0244_40645, partial [bacterium]|nr:hypothetical protein [bacterium]
RADHVALLVDGDKFSTVSSRHVLHIETIRMLDALIDNAALDKNDDVDVILSKKDIIEVSDRKRSIEKDFDRLTAEIHKRFSEKLGSIEFFVVAACPTEIGSGLEIGFGVDKLLKKWARIDDIPPKIKEVSSPCPISNASQFDQLGMKYFSQGIEIA